MTLVSVIMPTYNAEKWVLDAIDSVIAQTYPHVELIVVDDGSRDRTLAVVRDRLKKGFRGAWRIIELDRNRGPSAARNIGLAAASGSWIQFLDCDDLIAPEKFEREMAHCAKAESDVSAVYSPWRRCYLESGKITWEGPLAKPNMEGRPPIMCLVGGDRFLHAAGLTRRSILDRIGGFDESLRFWECEEVNVRIAKAGRLVRVHSEDALYLWRMHRDRVYIGSNKARYQLTPVALSWIELLAKAAEHKPLDQLALSAADRMEILHSCTTWARRLYSNDREAFRKFVATARTLDPKLRPSTPKYIAFISHYVGYEIAEAIAFLGAMPRALVRKILHTFRLRTRDSIFE